MKTVYSEKHRLHTPTTELYGGRLVPPFERPSRIDMILEAVRSVGLGSVIRPTSYGLEPVFRVHDAEFVCFLQTAWSEWLEAGFEGEAMPTNWPARRMQERCPKFIEGKLGYFAMSAETSIMAGTWDAVIASKDVALTAASKIIADERSVFALCRPPGHHAARDMYGGYCFLNNAAIAAQFILDSGLENIAILDIDFHHGNGTQDIFYDRSDVFFCSLHGDPQEAFPNFLGYPDETGAGAGFGFNANFPMPADTSFIDWRMTLDKALLLIRDYAPKILVVSLGVDTFEDDPISFFKLKTDDYKVIGRMISGLGIPVLFIMEGGYDIGEIGVNTVNVLTGFES